MKRFKWFVILVIFMLAVSACGGGSNSGSKKRTIPTIRFFMTCATNMASM